MPTAPYGSWRSPITAELIVSSSIGISQPRLDGDAVYWIESRPTEGGRNVIVRREFDGSTRDVIPPPYNARTRVHEYGGGDYLVHNGTVYFANFADQHIYLVRPGSTPVLLNPLSAGEEGTVSMHRYADFVLDAARNRLICVREDHSDPEDRPERVVNTIVAVDLSTGRDTVLASGHDFYAYPRLSPDGSSLAWIAWDHPNMPWDSTCLYVARLDGDGVPIEPKLIGGQEESIVQPEWSPDGRLYFVSDRTGWWNLYSLDALPIPYANPATHEGGTGLPITPHPGVVLTHSVEDAEILDGSGDPTSPVALLDAEFAKPLWQLGGSSYAFDASDSIVAVYGNRGVYHLARVDTHTGGITDIETPYSDFGSIQVAGRRTVFTGGSPTHRPALVSLDLKSGAFEVVKRTSSVDFDPRYVSAPETIEFPTTLDGQSTTAFGFYYPAHNPDYEAPATEKPPLLVMSHGGPTGATSPVLSPRVQYWTSRGVAVLDVNYGGSTGFGREYRERLKGRWGIVDVDDCVNGALYLARRGDVDPERIAITGGSAGGYTTLCVLTFRDAFKAGASHYGVADLEALATDTHKFESRYLDGLIGPYPERRDLYEARSPIHHVDRLSCPVIFFQGLEDRIVPPDQAERMVEALRRKGVPVAYFPFEGEQHGFRRAENIKRSLEAELAFYGRIFGFEPADDIVPFAIENL